MSKSKKRLVPVRRFKEFENADAWEQRKLGEVAEIKTGSRNHQDSVDNGKYPFFVRSEKVERLNEYDFDTKAILVPGDGRIGEIFHYYDGKFALHQRVYKVDNFKEVNPLYLLNLFKYKFKKHALRLNAQGTVPSLRLPMFTNWNILIPNLNEQQKIGLFFQQLDSLIALHQRKLDKLKRVKSAYLTEMFPAEGEREPKRRFPGFTGAWEQRKFFDNIEKVIDFRGRTPKKLGMEWSAEGYTALSALNVKDGYIDFTADVHYANQDLYDKWMVGNDLYKGQVLFTTEAPMGNVAQVPDNRKYVLSQRTIAFNVDKTKVTNDFLAVLLRSQNVQHTLKSLASGGTAQGVSQKSLSQLKVIVPIKPKEQQKIGDFFKQLDSLIALHQRKLDKLKKMKAAYLNEMFV